MRRVPLLLSLLAGASLGWGAAGAAQRLSLRAGPPGWVLSHPRVPAFPAVDQPIPEGEGWPIMELGTLRSRAAHESMEATLRIPPGDRVSLGLEQGPGRSVELVAEAGAARLAAFEGATGRWLDCGLPAPGEGATALRLQIADGGARVAVNGAETLCATPPLRAGAATLSAGYRRTAILELQGQRPGESSVLARVGAALLGAAVAAGLGRLGPRWAPAALLPLLACAPLVGADPQGLLQAMRVPAEEPLLWVILAPLWASVALALVGGVWEAARRGRWALALAAGGGGAAALAAAAQPLYTVAVAAAAGVGLALAGIVAANTMKIRGFNLVSLALSGVLVWSAEIALRFTATGASWAGVSSREAASLEGEWKQIAQERKFTLYPSSGYPVEPPPRDGRLRVVAFGGSSTGGAFKNDRLSDFWPARLEEDLGGRAQVVNQGVGGWTTLHIRRYVESGLDLVDPDVALLYVGHNDRMTPSAQPYRALFEAWERGGASSAGRLLADFRLYQGLRFGVQALSGRNKASVAVPLPDAEDNLRAIIAALRARGAKVLLMREAVSIGGELMKEYGRMECTLAQPPEVACFDAAAVLEDPLVGRVFLDNVHLDNRGHALLAGAVAAELDRLGWLAPELSPGSPATPER